MAGFHHGIVARWPDRKEEPADVGDKLLRTLVGLEQIDPAFSGWGLREGELARLTPLEELRERMTAFVQAEHIQSRGRAARGYGYNLLALNLMNYGQQIEPGRRLHFDVWAGATQRNLNRAVLAPHFGPPFAPEIAAYPVFKSMLLLIAQIWPSDWVNAAAFQSFYVGEPSSAGAEVIRLPSRPYSHFNMPWMTYLSPPVAAQYQPPAGILAEPAPDGGLVLIACEETLNPAKPDHLAQSDLLLNFLLETVGEPPRAGRPNKPRPKRKPRRPPA